MKPQNYDFAGYVTKNDIQCSDGVIIQQNAFKGNDGMKVPLVWNHNYNSISNVIGHILLHNNSEGVYGYGYLNDTEHGQDAKELIRHGDLWAMSIGAHRIQKNGNFVTHGEIYEVSLVLKGANRGALIEHKLTHSDDGSDSFDESSGIIYTGLENTILQHKDQGENNMSKTVGDVLDTLNDDQTEVVLQGLKHGFESLSDEDDEVLETLTDDQVHAVAAVISEAGSIEDAEAEADAESYGEGDEGGEGASVAHNIFEEGEDYFMKHNAFQSYDQYNSFYEDDVDTIIQSAIDGRASSLAGVFIDNGIGAEQGVTLQHGIQNIDVLFPETKLQKGIQVYNPVGRNVEKMLAAFSKSPMSRIKNIYADITEDEARARGYIKGNQKLESIERVFYRETTPHTVIRKTRMDRDDIIDIEENGIDIIQFKKATQLAKLQEELVRAAFLGDGRAAFVGGQKNPEHIDPEHVRPIVTDDDLYTIKVTSANWKSVVDDVQMILPVYQGSGSPSLFINPFDLAKLKTLKNANGSYLYGGSADANRIPTNDQIAAYFGCTEVVDYYPLPQGQFVIGNLSDYVFGTSKGGQVATFEQFDIDFNQQKYLTEVRVSGAIQTPKSFIVVNVTDKAENTAGKEALKFKTTGLKDSPSFTVDSAKDGTKPGPKYASTDTGSKKPASKPEPGAGAAPGVGGAGAPSGGSSTSGPSQTPGK